MGALCGRRALSLPAAGSSCRVACMALAGLVLQQVAPGAARDDWTAGPRIKPSILLRVQLHRNSSQCSPRRIKGHFASATGDGIAILLPSGSTETVQTAAVRSVSVRMAVFKRRGPLALTGATAGGLAGFIGGCGQGDARGTAMLAA